MEDEGLKIGISWNSVVRPQDPLTYPIHTHSSLIPFSIPLPLSLISEETRSLFPGEGPELLWNQGHQRQ